MARDSATHHSKPASLADSDRAQIEVWFVRRGVPQLIDDYTEELRMDARAGPYVLAWLVVGTVLWWGTRPDWSPLLNLVGIIATLASMALGVAAIRAVRGHVMWWVDRRLEGVDTFSLGILVAIPSMIIEQSVGRGIRDGRELLIGMGVIYVVIGLGLLSIGWWSLGRLRGELSRIADLLARTLPILLVLVLFLVFAAELWEAAHLLSGWELLGVVLLLVLIATLLVLTSLRSEVRALEEAGWETMRALAAETPASGLSEAAPSSPVPSLRFLQRLNVTALAVIAQLIQSAFVALLVSAFLVVFGLLVLPVALQETWIGGDVVSLAQFELLGETRILSRELVSIAVLLGSVTGLYFTGLAVTDSAYRTAHFERMLQEVRQLVAAHAFYTAAIRGQLSATDVS
ncbi:MAG TPA: hypothetical protein VHL52_09740 [Acidimicrobiia bacterium]|nr:hypothetical protein [Acidimicrobiia bacterium]